MHKYHAWRWSRQKIADEPYNLIVLPTASGGYEIHTKIRDFGRTLLKDVIPDIPNGDAELRKLFGGFLILVGLSEVFLKGLKKK